MIKIKSVAVIVDVWITFAAGIFAAFDAVVIHGLLFFFCMYVQFNFVPLFNRFEN